MLLNSSGINELEINGAAGSSGASYSESISELLSTLSSLPLSVPYVLITNSLVASSSSSYIHLSNEALADSGVFIDVLDYKQLVYLMESISLLISANHSVIDIEVVSDYLTILENIFLTFNNEIVDSLDILTSISNILTNSENILSSIGIEEVSNIHQELIGIINSIINITDLTDKIETESLTESLVLIEVIDSILRSLNIIIDSIILDPIVDIIKIVPLSITEYSVVTDPLISAANVYNSISNSFILSIPTSSGQDNYLAYLLSPETNSVSTYSNYNFDGCTKFGKKYLFFNKTGLYEYGGKTDDSSVIRSIIETVAYNFNSSNLKQIPAVYLGISSSGSTILKVRVDGRAEVIYKLSKKTKGLQTQKIDVGKGLIGRYFQFEIITESQDFNMESIEFFPIALRRKL